MIEIIVFILFALALFYAYSRKGAEQNQAEGNVSTLEFYEKQNVHFVNTKNGYVDEMKSELEDDLPHFNKLREFASNGARGKDFFGTMIGDETWLFPVSQKYLKDLYAMTHMDRQMESIPFDHATGYAPRGMPFMHTDDHWKELRKSLMPIFHNDFLEAYMGYFRTAVKELVKTWKSESGTVRNIKKDICDMAWNSSVYCVTGAKLDVNVPYNGPDQTEELHIRDVNAKTLLDLALHAATKDYTTDKDYRLKSNSMKINKLNQNMATLGGALTGLVEARAGEIAGGAPTKKTIVDAAYGLLVAGVIKDVNEAVQHGWAILNGAHLNCGNALAAAMYYLIQNPDCYDKVVQEIRTELFKGKSFDEDTLDEVVLHDKVHDLDYLSYVVKETLRLSSPIYGKPMRAKEDVKLEGNFTIKKGTVVYPNNGIIGVSENIWEDPMEFIPERFDPESKYFKLPDHSKREPITWLAFGAGPRACMGDNFSMYFMKVGIIYFVHMFRFTFDKANHREGFFYWLNDKNFTAEVRVK